MRRTPLALAPGALPLVAVLAALPALEAGAWAPPLLALGAFAGALCAVALLGLWPAALPWGLGLLAAEYVVGLELRGAGLDPTAPLYAAALFLCAELGWLGLEARGGAKPWWGRALGALSLALAGAAAGYLALLSLAVPLPGGALVTALGVVAAVAACGWLAALSRSRGNGPA